jgi:hypothetical protein
MTWGRREDVVILASACNSSFHSRTCDPLLPPPSQVIVKALGVRVVRAADVLPPTADRLDGRRGGVVTHADTDPAGVGGQIVDPRFGG